MLGNELSQRVKTTRRKDEDRLRVYPEYVERLDHKHMLRKVLNLKEE